MKRLLLSIGVISLSAGLSAQTYFSENFDSGLGQFTSVDNDGDGNEWTTADVTGNINSTGSSAISNSWTSSAGPITPDNLLVSSAINLTAVTGSITLAWQSGNIETTNNWWEENYDVIVTTSNATATILAATPVYNEVLPSGGTMFNRSVDLSAFAGQTIYVTFRHHNCTDENFLIIDEVSLFTPVPVDMEMSAITVAPVVAAGNVNITGTVTSLGQNNITSIDISWNDGSGANNQTFPVNLNYGDSYNFTHGTPLNAVGGTDYNVTVTVTAASDADNNNDALTTLISTVTQVVPKTVVGEEKTGEWCGWCPRGAVAMAQMALSNPNDWIGIAVHNGDPMAFAAYDGNIGTYVPGGYPGGGVDRVIDGDPSQFSAMHAQRVNMIPPASVSVVGTYAGSTLTIDVTADFVGSLNGDYRLAAVVLEDDVTGTQANYYDDGNAGALQMPNGGSMPNFNFVGGGSTVSPFYHDHVARALGSNQINGAAGSLPASITAGQQLSHSYTFTNTSSWNMANVHVVGMLVNGTTGEILNAAKAEIAAINELDNTNFNVNVAPNPTNGVANIIVDLEEASELDVVIVDMLGNVVYQLGSTDLAAGSFSVAMDLSNEANGVYFAKVSVNGTEKTVKINVAK